MRGCCSAVVSTGSKNRSTAAETETALRLVDRHELGDDSHAEVVATEVAFWPDMIREKTAFPDAYLPTDRSNSSSSRSCDLNVGSNSGGCGGSRLARIGGSWADRSIDSSADSWRENEEEDTTYYSSNHTRSTISRGTGAGRGRRNHCHDKTFRLSRHVRLSLRESVYLVAVIFIALTSTGGPRSTVSAAAAVLGGRIGAAGVEEELPSDHSYVPASFLGQQPGNFKGLEDDDQPQPDFFGGKPGSQLTEEDLVRYGKALRLQQQKRQEGDSHLLRFNRAGDGHLLRFSKRSGDDADMQHMLRFSKRANEDDDMHMLRFSRRMMTAAAAARPTRSDADDHLLRFSRAMSSGDDSDDEHWLRYNRAAADSGHLLRFSKRGGGGSGDDRTMPRYNRRMPGAGDDHLLRFSRSNGGSSDDDEHLLRFSRANSGDDDYLLRYSRSSSSSPDAHLLRFSRGGDDHLLRYSRSNADDHLLRFSRASADDDHLLRFSRSSNPDDHLLRFSRSGPDDHLLRFSRSGSEGDEHLLRFSRSSPDEHLLRFSRANPGGHLLRFSRSDAAHLLRFSRSNPAAADDEHLLRFSRSSPDQHLLRFSRSSANEEEIKRSNDAHLLRFSKRAAVSQPEFVASDEANNDVMEEDDVNKEEEEGEGDDGLDSNTEQWKRYNRALKTSNSARLMRYARSLAEEEPSKPRLVRQDAHLLRFN